MADYNPYSGAARSGNLNDWRPFQDWFETLTSIQTQTAGMVSVKSYGAVANNTADDTVAVAAAHAYANANGLGVYYPSVCKITADIPYFHDVPKYGPGGVQVAGSRVWRATPGPLVNTYALRQTLYLNATLGNDSNAGLGPGALALATVGGAKTILAKYGFLLGNWALSFAAGEYTTGIQFFGMSNDGHSPLYLDGPAVSAWDNTARPANADATGGSVPTAIFRPTIGNRGDGAGWGLDFQHRMHVVLTNIKGRDWGSTAGTNDEGFVRTQYRGSLRLINCHTWNCSRAACARDFSHLTVDGGMFQLNSKAFYLVAGARYDLGHGSSANGQTTAPLVCQNTFGLDVWEGANGHPDYALFEDNGTHAYIRKGGHASFFGPTFANTGAHGTSIGIQVADGGNYKLDGNEVWIGTHTRRIQRWNNGVNVDETAYADRLLAWNYADQTTVSTTELSVCSLTVPKGEFVYEPQAIIARLSLISTDPNATALLKIKAGSSILATGNIKLNGSAMNNLAEIVMRHLGADRSNTQRVSIEIRQSNTNGTVNVIAQNLADAAQDFTTADLSINVTVTAGNAADSIVVKTVELWRRG